MFLLEGKKMKTVIEMAIEAGFEIDLDEICIPSASDVYTGVEAELLRFAELVRAEALAEQPAQQEPKIDIYRSFEQWKSGNVLEHGVPRTEHYSEAQLDLVEMGWNYGYDAGRAVEQALDKKAENARELGLDYEPAQQEPVALKWQQAPVKTQWGDEMVVASVAIDNDHTLSLYCERDQAPKVDAMFAQRTWVGLTDEDIEIAFDDTQEGGGFDDFARAIEAKLRSKNT
jgi:hypothetical protein